VRLGEGRNRPRDRKDAGLQFVLQMHVDSPDASFLLKVRIIARAPLKITILSRVPIRPHLVVKKLKTQNYATSSLSTTAMPTSRDSCATMTRDRTSWRLFAALAPLGLYGCVSDETASRLLVEPDRYILYSCPELATAEQTKAARQRELEGLMAKAGPSPGGQLARKRAFRPEYAQLQGEMDPLRKAAADKNCKSAPGTGGVGGRSSNQIVR